MKKLIIILFLMFSTFQLFAEESKVKLAYDVFLTSRYSEDIGYSSLLSGLRIGVAFGAEYQISESTGPGLESSISNFIMPEWMDASLINFGLKPFWFWDINETFRVKPFSGIEVAIVLPKDSSTYSDANYLFSGGIEVFFHDFYIQYAYVFGDESIYNTGSTGSGHQFGIGLNRKL